MKKPVKGNAFHKLNIAVLITCVAFGTEQPAL